MGFFSAIKDFFSGKDDAEKIKDLSAEVSRYADRFENAGDEDNAALARDYAGRIMRAGTLANARLLFQEFKAIVRKHEEPADHTRDREYDDNDDWSDDS